MDEATKAVAAGYTATGQVPEISEFYVIFIARDIHRPNKNYNYRFCPQRSPL